MANEQQCLDPTSARRGLLIAGSWGPYGPRAARTQHRDGLELQRIQPGVAAPDVTAPTSRRQSDERSAELLAGIAADRVRRAALTRLRVRSMMRGTASRARLGWSR